MTCRCHPSNRCGRCDLPDLRQALADFEAAEKDPRFSARRDDEEWNERVRRVAAMNEGSPLEEEEDTAA